MSLAEQIVSIGPLNVPVGLIAVAAALLLIAILQRTVWRDDRESWSLVNEVLSTGVLIGFVVWKVTPAATRFDQVLAAPARLLFYPGGTAGLIAGLVATIGYCLLRGLRLRRTGRLERPGRAVLHLALLPAMATAAFAVVALVPVTDRSVRLPELTFLDGHAIVLRDDVPTVITAWATWCRPCTAQMPEIERFHLRHGGDANVVSLNLTNTEPSLDAVAEYLAGNSYSVAVALDDRGRLATLLQITATPTTIVLDPRGRERARRIGAVNADWLARRTLPLGR